MALFAEFVRDVVPIAVLILVAATSWTTCAMRGVTYRASVIPEWLEKCVKAMFYIGLLGVIDSALRRSGQLAHLAGVPMPGTEGFYTAWRAACLHVPFALWAVTGPLNPGRTTRDDSGWSKSATRSPFWFWFSRRVFRDTRILLSEEWRDLSPTQRAKWHDRQYVIAMHPHGLLPIGAILNGLTWASGGLQGVTSSGTELREPTNGGDLLHQRWFPKMKLRAGVASGACGLFPGFYEMFRWLGCFDCTEPFVRKQIRNGRDVALFPGGAAESKYAIPGRYVLYSKHHGFLRIALEERRDVLPMWCFGDEAVVPQMRSPPQFLAWLQKRVKETCGLLVPPTLASLPQFNPLSLVTGVPVSLEDLWPTEPGGKATEAAIAEALRRYLEAQRKLFDTNKRHVPGGHAFAVLEVI